MESGILKAIGLGGLDVFFLFLIPILLCLVLFILFFLMKKRQKEMEYKYQKFMRGRDAQTLEEEIFNIFEENDQITEELKQHREDLQNIHGILTHSFMKIGLVKYDAFSQMGGKMSYVLVLLDERNNGFIMNTVHSTENCYSYVKKVEGGRVEVDLGEEEQKALRMAIEEEYF